MTEHLNAGCRQLTPTRKGERNGHYRRIDVTGLDPLGRLAGNYTRIETIFELPADEL